MKRISETVKTINVGELKIKEAEYFSKDYATHDSSWPFLESPEAMFDKEKMQKLFDLLNYLFIIKKDPEYSFHDFRCDLCIGQVDWTRNHKDDDKFWSVVDNTLYRMATRLGIDISGEKW